MPDKTEIERVKQCPTFCEVKKYCAKQHIKKQHQEYN